MLEWMNKMINSESLSLLISMYIDWIVVFAGHNVRSQASPRLTTSFLRVHPIHLHTQYQEKHHTVRHTIDIWHNYSSSFINIHYLSSITFSHTKWTFLQSCVNSSVTSHVCSCCSQNALLDAVNLASALEGSPFLVDAATWNVMDD